MTVSITYEILNYPEYLFFILDIDYRDYFQYIRELTGLFSNKISINNIEYNLKGIICMPNELHYTSYIFNNSENYLDMGMNKTLFHDGKKNKGFIIESEEDAEEIIKKVVSYIFILIKS